MATATRAGGAILDGTQRVLSRTQKILRFLRIAKPTHPVTWLPQILFYAAVAFFLRVVWTSGTLGLPVVIAFAPVCVFWVLATLLESTFAGNEQRRASGT